jgi:hypothetical protein
MAECNSELLGNLEIDRELTSDRLHDRGRLLAFENAAEIEAGLAIRFRANIAVARQTDGLDQAPTSGASTRRRVAAANAMSISSFVIAQNTTIDYSPVKADPPKDAHRK